MIYLCNPHNNWFKSPLVGMQPFKLVPILSARIPGRITSPRGLDEAAEASQGMGTSRNRPSDGTRFVSYNSCVQLMLLRCYYVFVTNGYTVTLLHLWSCAIAMNSTARRYPSYILKEQEGFCHERDASKGQTVLELVSSLLPNSIVVVHMSHP